MLNINQKNVQIVNSKKLKYLFVSVILLLPVLFYYGCVETLTGDQQSTSATPTIQILDPTTGDSVSIGDNYVTYQAADGTGGAGLSFYEVYLNGKFVKRYDQNTDGTNPDIYLTVDSTLLKTTINYKIKVYNLTSKSKESDLQENIYVRDKVPDAPSDLILTKLNDFSVNLLWDDNSNNETGFELWRKDGGGGTYRKIKTLPPNTISTDDASLSAFVDYFYKVRAYNTTGYSGFSAEVSTSSIAGGPWNLQAEAIGASVIHLTWTDFAVNELGFIIERTNPFTTNFERIAIVGRGSTEYYDNSVTASTGYKYRVAYYTSTSISAYSNEAIISTYYTDEAGPSDLVAAIDSTTSAVTLTWKNNTSLAKSTIIERKIGTSGTFAEYATTTADTTEAFDFGIIPNTIYYYRLRQSLGTRTYTPYSNEAKVTVPQ